jgi:hypothetical protein
MKTIMELYQDGDVEQCDHCGKFSAYHRKHVDAQRGIEKVAFSAANEWQCGHCGTLHVNVVAAVDVVPEPEIAVMEEGVACYA